MAQLRIGELAAAAQVNVDTVRYYERRGLLPDPPRSESGYRLYSAEDVRRLKFIRRAQEMGFTLREIDDLLSLRVDPDTTCGDIKRRVRTKISLIDAKIAELETFKRALQRVDAACEGGSSPKSQCPVLDALSAEDQRGHEGKDGETHNGNGQVTTRPPDENETTIAAENAHAGPSAGRRRGASGACCVDGNGTRT